MGANLINAGYLPPTPRDLRLREGESFMARLATKCCPVVGDGEVLRFGKEADCNPDEQCGKKQRTRQ